MAAFTYTLVISGSAATSAVFTPVSTPLTAPVPPGTVVGSVEVEPDTWSGVLTVDAPFAMSGHNVVVGPQPLPAGSHAINGMATP